MKLISEFGSGETHQTGARRYTNPGKFRNPPLLVRPAVGKDPATMSSAKAQATTWSPMNTVVPGSTTLNRRPVMMIASNCSFRHSGNVVSTAGSVRCESCIAVLLEFTCTLPSW